jgi:uncharacterized membrane protein SirB2
LPETCWDDWKINKLLFLHLYVIVNVYCPKHVEMIGRSIHYYSCIYMLLLIYILPETCWVDWKINKLLFLHLYVIVNVYCPKHVELIGRSINSCCCIWLALYIIYRIHQIQANITDSIQLLYFSTLITASYFPENMKVNSCLRDREDCWFLKCIGGGAQ